MNNDHKDVSKGNILVIDDNRDNLRVLTELLSEEGYLVRPVPESSRALLSAQAEPPDVILLDIRMPEISGYEVCEQLKADERTRDIPVIFISALHEVFDKVKAFAVGGVDYITKPFQREELLARVHTHLTIRKQQQYIQHQNQQLNALNASKDKFFSIIAHDLRGPFVGLLAIAQLIKENLEKWSKDDINNIADKLLASAENLYALLENLLTWARIQQGTIEVAPEMLDVRHVVARNMSLFTPNTEQKQLTFRNLINTALVVYADANAIDTVMRNLFSNAIKFTQVGGTITISAKQTETAVEVSVADTGIGIPGTSLPKLFRIDTSYHKRGTAGEQGTGLGLILCKDLIEKNGGRIWINSEVGQGTTFTFTLPKAGS